MFILLMNFLLLPVKRRKFCCWCHIHSEVFFLFIRLAHETFRQQKRYIVKHKFFHGILLWILSRSSPIRSALVNVTPFTLLHNQHKKWCKKRKIWILDFRKICICALYLLMWVKSRKRKWIFFCGNKICSSLDVSLTLWHLNLILKVKP